MDGSSCKTKISGQPNVPLLGLKGYMGINLQIQIVKGSKQKKKIIKWTQVLDIPPWNSLGFMFHLSLNTFRKLSFCPRWAKLSLSYLWEWLFPFYQKRKWRCSIFSLQCISTCHHKRSFPGKIFCHSYSCSFQSLFLLLALHVALKPAVKGNGWNLKHEHCPIFIFWSARQGQWLIIW